MEIKIDDQTGKVTVSSNKTQSLMASDSISGQKEAIVVNNDSRTDKVLVAKLVKKSNRILVTIRTHRFPFDFFPDTLNRMIGWLDNHQGAAIASCNLINEQGKQLNFIRRFPTVWNQLAIILKISHLFPGVLNKYLPKDFDYKKELSKGLSEKYL